MLNRSLDLKIHLSNHHQHYQLTKGKLKSHSNYYIEETRKGGTALATVMVCLSPALDARKREQATKTPKPALEALLDKLCKIPTTKRFDYKYDKYIQYQ